ncbi:asparagine synthase (glutamine-hydrolyzing) [Ulvibacter litoralis]|uniref:asparagine synthase (glutamine-hydrolyzing) n=1 Tax=Ulvibacter litoralis TaxID=227084 RepID=A0A1G7GVX3_9FLAO|nr:asparagine synthase (glutamine-hydrolyzing) [Ulvibacter litoralis]GHC59919.1 asparagine synthetase B [Ulvibacter litoralis]SDE92320.1 asparagine synthase (glutamine-hydrolysing) [Ulvibacter litoralis]
MCGIAGIIGESASEKTLNTMLARQKHRGPDNTGKCIEIDAVLGHNRLSIIDLSAEANQPFYSIDKQYILVFNGEIYNYLELKKELEPNYKFTTTSDTEVLLAAYLQWGSECLSKCNGMFSFAIWDTVEKKLFGARDRFGVKPFYYSIQDSSFYFASEIKTLFSAAIPKKANEKVWASYFAFGSYGMPNETFWEGIEQLPGGHFFEFKEGELTIKKWYVFEEEVKKHKVDRSFEEVQAVYKDLLADSIKLRFRADVPIGFNVSGGLDSSTLLAMVAETENGENINAYTFYTGDENYDELPWVEGLIENTKNPLHKIKLNVADVKSLSESMSSFQDEPYGGVPTVAYGEIFKQARKDGVLVLLDGQGMDEQWAGYDYYVKKNDSVIQGVKKSPFRKDVLESDFLNKAVKPIYPTPFDDAVLNLQYRDLFYTKIPRALRFNDRVSMASSTELREPFLDYRLVELAFAQPLKYKIKNNEQKYLLRCLVSELLSDSIRFAPKRPLQTPQREWLGDDLKDWVQQEINSLSKNKWFNTEKLQNELKAYFEGDRDSSFHIWQWINTSLLYKG